MTLKTSAVFATAMFLAGCGGQGGGAGGSGGEGGATTTTTGTHEGGAGGQGGDGGEGGSGGSSGCPAEPPRSYQSCAIGLECSYLRFLTVCQAELPVEATCPEGTWRVRSPAACEPLPPGATCDPTGHYQVTETGPYDPPVPELAGYTGPFELVASTGPDGILYVEADYGQVSTDGCQLSVTWILAEDSGDEDGGWFSWYSRNLHLDLSVAPATGTVTVQCDGECGGATGAPVEATELP